MTITEVLSPKEIILKAIKDIYITIAPIILLYGKINKNMAFQLSKGYYKSKLIYCVQVVEYNPLTTNTSLKQPYSDCFDSIDKAYDHIDKLRKEYKDKV